MHCSGGDDNAVNWGRADAPGNLLDLAIQRPAELRTDVGRLSARERETTTLEALGRLSSPTGTPIRIAAMVTNGRRVSTPHTRNAGTDRKMPTIKREIGVALENEQEQAQTPRTPDALARRLVHARSSPSSSAASASSVSILWSTSSCTCGSRPQCRASSKLSMASSNRPSIWSACPSAACAVPR